MPRKRQVPNADESFLLLYHLYRTGIIPRSDLPLYRGNSQDRYVQRLVTKHIKAGHIGINNYYRCEYCFITPKGVEYLHEREANIRHHNPLMDECAAYVLESPDILSTPERIQSYLSRSTKKREINGKGQGKGARNEGIAVEGDQTSMGTSDKNGTSLGTSEASSNELPPGNPNQPNFQRFILGDEGWEPQERKPVRRMHTQTVKKVDRLIENDRPPKFRSDIRRGGVENLMYGSGVIVYEEDRPDFKKFLSILSKPDYTKTFLWKLICERGVYYPRRALNTKEAVYDNRMQGVLFLKTGWYVIYNTLGRFSKWISSTESHNSGRLTEAMHSTIAYMGCQPSSIVFAVGRGMVATMVSGYIYGHIRKDKIPDFIKRNNRSEYYMTVEQMKQLYKQIYLVELNSGGIYSLNWLIETDEEQKAKELQAMALGNPGKFTIGRTSNGNPVLTETASGREIVVQRAYDLTDLYNRRNQSGEVTVIGPSWMAEATSKCLNWKLARYISVDDGFDVSFTRYDENGDKIENQKGQKTT